MAIWLTMNSVFICSIRVLARQRKLWLHLSTRRLTWPLLPLISEPRTADSRFLFSIWWASQGFTWTRSGAKNKDTKPRRRQHQCFLPRTKSLTNLVMKRPKRMQNSTRRKQNRSTSLKGSKCSCTITRFVQAIHFRGFTFLPEELTKPAHCLSGPQPKHKAKGKEWQRDASYQDFRHRATILEGESSRSHQRQHDYRVHCCRYSVGDYSPGNLGGPSQAVHEGSCLRGTCKKKKTFAAIIWTCSRFTSGKWRPLWGCLWIKIISNSPWIASKQR